MKKFVSFLLPVTATLFTACSLFGGTSENFSISAGEMGIFIESDGTVLYSFAEDFGKDYYNKDDMEKLVSDEISSYNSKNNKSAEVEEFDVENNVAKAKIKFESVADLVLYRTQFEKADEGDLFVGSIKNAVIQEVEIAGEFTRVKDGVITQETAISSEIKKLNYEIVIVHHKAKIEIEDANIEYLSSNCKLDNGVVTVTEEETENEVAYVVYSK